MNKRENEMDQELDDFLNDESDINKIYAERDSLKAPAHLEFSVKQMARESISSESVSEKENLNKKTSDNSKMQPRRKFFIPVALAASVVVAVTLTLVLFQDQSAPLNVAQTPINNSNSTLPEESQSLAVEDVVNDEAIIINPVQSEDKPTQRNQLAQQRVTSTQDSVANDVKKSKFERREKLASETESIKKDDAIVKQDSPHLAQQAPSEVPDYINELIQNTSANHHTLNGMPPAEVLRNWQKSQWVEQVTTLNKQGNRELAERYVQAYPEYFPDESIRYLLKP